MPTHPLKWRSAALTDGDSRAPARAMLRATGLTDDDLGRPLIGVANTWIEIGPCNYHLRDLAAHGRPLPRPVERELAHAQRRAIHLQVGPLQPHRDGQQQPGEHLERQHRKLVRE